MSDLKEKTSALEAAMDALFAYKIGDVVVARATAARFAWEAKTNGQVRVSKYLGANLASAPALTVLERWAVQCHGGTQRMYLVADEATNRRQVSETELVAFEEAMAPSAARIKVEDDK